MKVKAIKQYYDLDLKKVVKAGDEFEVTNARAKELSTANNKAGKKLVEIISTGETAKGKKKKET